MSRGRFARLKAMVLAAAEMPPAERSAHLDAACGGDEEMRREAVAMLGREEASGADGLVERCDAALAEVVAGMPEVADAMSDLNDPPRHIGAYEILEELGRGGMGVVFRAEQTGPLRRQVALKLLPSGTAGVRSIRRFAAERQALALMEHPNIARVYDAGETDDGRPYFAMELVPGLSITRYCAEHHLGLRDRLQLMLPVCAAVQHAHQKGVVHRDLKPSNILVAESNGSPDPKVIDFGIAKADAELVAGGATLTLEGQLLGTLNYMSPEQVAGAPDVDTRTDVYSLGVILYELVTGKRPHEVKDLGLGEAIRIIQEQPPPPVTTSQPENRRVDVDLRTVVEKALAKSAAERYATAAALGDDLEHYLAGQPIAARPPSTTYQLRKLVGRHRLPAVLVAALVVVLAIFGVTMSVLFGAQSVQRQRAEAEAAKATAVVDFVVDMLGSANPGHEGRDVTVQEVLAIASDDLRNSFADQPEVSASVHRTLGVTYRALGLYGEAELHLRTALALRDSMFVAQQPDRLESLDDLAGFHMEMGDFTTADTLYSELLDHARQRAEIEPIVYANALNNTALVRQALGRLEEAAAMLNEAIEVDRGLRADDDPARTAAVNNLATVLTLLGRYTEAEVHMRAALVISESQHPDNHPDLVTERSNLAKIWHRLGRYAEADSLYRSLQPALEEIYDAGHPRVAIGRINLAMVLQDRGQLDQADSLFARSVEPLIEALGPEHPYSSITYAYLGLLRRAQGDLLGADELLTRGCDRLVAARGEDSPHLAIMLQHLAGVRHALGDTTAAEAHYRRALKIWSVVADSDDHPNLAAGRYGLGCLLLDRGDLVAAEPLLLRAREALARNLPPEHRTVALAANAHAAAMIRLGRRDEGEPLLMSSHDQLLADPGLEPFDRAVVVRRSHLLEPAR